MCLLCGACYGHAAALFVHKTADLLEIVRSEMCFPHISADYSLGGAYMAQVSRGGICRAYSNPAAPWRTSQRQMSCGGLPRSHRRAHNKSE